MMGFAGRAATDADQLPAAIGLASSPCRFKALHEV
jgi:hypothetical protein